MAVKTPPQSPSIVHHDGNQFVYTVATLVTDLAQLGQMRETFEAAGFTSSDTEFLYVDNTGTGQVSAFDGLNRLLNDAQGRYVILCHQDVRIIFDGRDSLDACLRDLEQRDPAWAVAGNAGGIGPGRLAMRITDPHGADRRIGDLPALVSTLDENFIVVKRSARIGFSRNLTGFHLYGADICLAADILGYHAYVIDFHLHHLSPGRKSADFDQAVEDFTAKWSRALRPRLLQTTCTLLALHANPVISAMAGACAGTLEKVARHLPRAAGWRPASRKRA